MKVAPQINQVRSSKYGHVLEYGSHQESTTQGSRDRLLVRAPDSWSKGCEFESRQERRENFLLQSQLCVLTRIRYSFQPRVTTVARKRPRSFCGRRQATPKHAYTLDPTKSEWADYAAVHACVGICLEISSHVTCQGTFSFSVSLHLVFFLFRSSTSTGTLLHSF